MLNAIAAGATDAIKKTDCRSPSTLKARRSRVQSRRTGFTDGRIHRKDPSPAATLNLLTFCRWRGSTASAPKARRSPTWEDPKAKDVSLHSYGAQFVEVEWEPDIARLRVSRVVTVIDAGRIINPKAAANQIEGAVVMGVGMGLLEETITTSDRAAHQRQHGRLLDGNLCRRAIDRCDVPRLSRSGDGRVRCARRGRDRAGRRGCGHHCRGLSCDRCPRARVAGAHREPAAIEDLEV